jgi:hypothetical protein
MLVELVEASVVSLHDVEPPVVPPVLGGALNSTFNTCFFLSVSPSRALSIRTTESVVIAETFKTPVEAPIETVASPLKTVEVQALDALTFVAPS